MTFLRNFCAPFSVRTSLWTKVIFLSLFLPQTVSAQIVISEILYDAEGSDTKAEWVELHNIGSAVVDISKWKFNDGSNHALNAPPKNGSRGSLVMDAGSYLILTGDAASFSPTVSVSVIDTVMSLNNQGDTVTLIDDQGNAIDTVSYSKEAGGNGTGESLQRHGSAFLPAIPTPGRTNSLERIKVPVKSQPVKAPIKKISATEPEKNETELLAAVKSEIEEDAPQAASVVVPIGSNSSTVTPWAFAALALGVAGAGAVFIARQKRKGEWEIEEIA